MSIGVMSKTITLVGSLLIINQLVSYVILTLHNAKSFLDKNDYLISITIFRAKSRGELDQLIQPDGGRGCCTDCLGANGFAKYQSARALEDS